MLPHMSSATIEGRVEWREGDHHIRIPGHHKPPDRVLRRCCKFMFA